MITDRSQFLYNEAEQLVDQVKKVTRKLESEADLDPLMDDIGQARYVLLGTASHGTSEYYIWRARLSQRLIREKGFSFIAVDGSWSDCAQVNRYVKNYPDAGESGQAVLDAFKGWPTWMWANWETVALVEWLRRYNDNRANKVGFYGLDWYSLWETMGLITDYLEQTDPEAAEAARLAWVNFEPFARDAYADEAGDLPLVTPAYEEQVINLLTERYQHAYSGRTEPGAGFEAEQSTLPVGDAESYYRTLIRGGIAAWNVRAQHLTDTLERLMAYHGPGAKGIIWAHNSHVGDARATDKVMVGRVNPGQLVRERHGDEAVVLIGHGSYRGSVIAGQKWGASMERMPVPQATEGSWGDVLHQAGANNKLLLLSDVRNAQPFLELRGHRSIGVVYNSARERFSHYTPIVLPHGYDAFLYFDETQVIHPLHILPESQAQQPEGYPWEID